MTQATAEKNLGTIYGLILAVVFDIALTLAVIVLAINNHAQDIAIQHANLDGCRANNVIVQHEHTIWTQHIYSDLKYATSPSEVKDRQKQLSLVNLTFVPTNCNAVYGGK